MANIEIKQGNKIIHNKTKMEKRTLLFYRHSCGELPKSSSKPAASLLPDVNRESELKVLVIQLHPSLCDPMDCSPPGSSVHRISHARILEWVAMPSSRGSSRLGSNPRLLPLPRWQEASLFPYHQHHLGNPHSQPRLNSCEHFTIL